MSSVADNGYEEQLLKDVKSFLRMPEPVTTYDDEVAGLIATALMTASVAGITQPSALLTEYVKTYVRARMLQDASQVFINSEKTRENEILSTIIYGIGG